MRERKNNWFNGKIWRLILSSRQRRRAGREDRPTNPEMSNRTLSSLTLKPATHPAHPSTHTLYTFTSQPRHQPVEPMSLQPAITIANDGDIAGAGI